MNVNKIDHIIMEANNTPKSNPYTTSIHLLSMGRMQRNVTKTRLKYLPCQNYASQTHIHIHTHTHVVQGENVHLFF